MKLNLNERLKYSLFRTLFSVIAMMLGITAIIFGWVEGSSVLFALIFSTLGAAIFGLGLVLFCVFIACLIHYQLTWNKEQDVKAEKNNLESERN